MSTTWIKRVKLYGTVDLNGIHAKVKEHVKTGDLLLFEYEDNSGKLTPPDNVSILYETESYAVVNKPAGMVTHPSYGHLDDSGRTGRRGRHRYADSKGSGSRQDSRKSGQHCECEGWR